MLAGCRFMHVHLCPLHDMPGTWVGKFILLERVDSVHPPFTISSPAPTMSLRSTRIWHVEVKRFDSIHVVHSDKMQCQNVHLSLSKLEGLHNLSSLLALLAGSSALLGEVGKGKNIRLLCH
jgi:hypothetical protein